MNYYFNDKAAGVDYPGDNNVYYSKFWIYLADKNLIRDDFSYLSFYSSYSSYRFWVDSFCFYKF